MWLKCVLVNSWCFFVKNKCHQQGLGEISVKNKIHQQHTNCSCRAYPVGETIKLVHLIVSKDHNHYQTKTKLDYPATTPPKLDYQTTPPKPDCQTTDPWPFWLQDDGSTERETSNPFFDNPQYLKYLSTWKNNYGGNWPGLEVFISFQAQSPRQVTPRAVAQLRKLVSILIQDGCKNAVVFPARLESACCAFAGLPGVTTSCKISIRVLASAFSVHLQSVLALIRNYAQEEAKLAASAPSSSSARHPKSGAVRKSMSFADKEVMNDLAGMLSLKAAPVLSPGPIAEPLVHQPVADAAATSPPLQKGLPSWAQFEGDGKQIATTSNNPESL